MRFPVFASFLLLAVSAWGAGPEQAVEQAERAWAAGVVKPDYDVLSKVLADDLSYTHSTGAKDTKQTYIDNLKTGKAKYFMVEYDELNVKMLDKDAAYAVAKVRVRTLNNGQPTDAKLTLLHVFQLRKGQWQLVAHQSARLP